MPSAEVEVTEAMVVDLLRRQFPDLAGRPLRRLAHGWDNELFRLGDELLVRLPRRAMAAGLVDHERAWLPTLARLAGVPAPVPCHDGVPGSGYPWSWSIVPWIEGVTAADAEPAPARDGRQLALDLGSALGRLARPAPPAAPANPWRGVPLAHRDADTRARIDRLADVVDADACRRAWDRALEVATWAAPPVWLHGDLHPANIVVRLDGSWRLAGLLDWGDLCAGDPATDLAVGWMLFDAADRAAFLDAAGVTSDATVARAAGWALSLALAYTAQGADNPTLTRVGGITLARVLSEAGTVGGSARARPAQHPTGGGEERA